jgi:hypothetical protein
MASGFILSTILSHWKENYFTRLYFIASSFWLGLMLNLVMALALAWVIIWLSKTAGYNINLAYVGILFLIAGFSYSFYGIWNAYHPVIKNITVAIPNLPESWKGRKIIQLSDIHLGQINQAGFLESIVRQVNSLRPDLVVITGDLFDGMGGNLAPLAAPLNGIQSEKGIYFITGNHETYLGIDNVRIALSRTKVNWLPDKVVDIDGLKLIGIDYPERGENKDELAVLQSLKKDYFGHPSILLYHSPVNFDRTEKMGVNLQLAGHTHAGQVFPIQFIDRLIYKKYYYGLHIKNNFSLYTTSGAGFWGPTMRTGNHPEIAVITLK